MILNPRNCVAFTGHRTYRNGAGDSLLRTLESLYERGFRVFLSGMAIGFDLAAAEAVLSLRSRHPDVQLIAAIPFRGQEADFSPSERERYVRVLAAADDMEILAPAYHRGCYSVRNRFLVDHAGVVVAWYNGRASGGTHQTVELARQRRRELINLYTGESLFTEAEKSR